jgi:predicted component of type VI protein secretion system
MAIQLHIHNLTHDQAPQTRTFQQPEVLIGRDPHCDVQLPDPHAPPLAATLLSEPRRVLLATSNTDGVRLNRKPTAPQSTLALRDGDHLAIGGLHITISLAAHQPNASADVSAEESNEHLQAIIAARIDRFISTEPSPSDASPNAHASALSGAPPLAAPQALLDLLPRAAPPRPQPQPSQRPPPILLAVMAALIAGGVWLILVLFNVL